MSREGETTDTSRSGSTPRVKRSRIRAGYRTHTSKLLNDARDEIRRETPSVSTLQKLSVSLKEKLNVLRKIDEEVFLEIKEEDLENEVFQYEEIRSDIHGVLVEIEDRKPGFVPEKRALYISYSKSLLASLEI